MRLAVAIGIPILMVAGLAIAAERAPLTLAGAVERAIASSPAAGASESQAAAAAAGIREAQAGYRPSLGIAGSATRYSDPMVATPIHGFTPQRLPRFEETLTQAALTASYTLFDSGARRANVEQARALAAASNATADTVRQQVALRTAAAFAGVLSRVAMVEAQDARLRALAEERSRVEQFESVGRAAHVEMLRVEAAVAAGEAERADASAALDAEERALARLTGLPLEETRAANLEKFDPAGAATPPREELERRAREAPVVQQARAQALAAHAAVSLARSGNRPQVAANAADVTYGSDRAILENDWNVGVGLRMSVFDGGLTAARVARATAAAKAADEQVRAAELEASLAIDQGLSDLEQALSVAASLRKAVASYAEVARVEKLRLENGAGTQSDYLRSEADLAGARANLAAAEYRSAVSRIDLARLAGELDAKWLTDTFRSSR